MKELKFQINEKVKINELERTGRIISIWITKSGIQYEVRYFDKCEARNVYFYEDEIARSV